MVEVDIDIAGIMAKAREADKQARLAYANEDLLPAAVEKCPKLTGAMAGTGQVEEEDEEVMVSFGPLPYVLKQYYDDTLHHNNGESHWTERAAVETADKLAEREAEAFKEAFG